MKVLYSGFTWPHHSKNSGYDKITDYPGADYISVNNVAIGNKSIKKRIYTRLNLYLLDLKTKILRYKYDIVHLIYTEQQLYFPYREMKKNKVVGTIHLNPDFSFFSKRLYCFKTLNAIIVLKKDLVESIYNKTGVETYYVPHGFNKPYFRKVIPVNMQGNLINTDMINICVIGSNYRDYNTINVVLQNNVNKNIFFHFVGQPREIIDVLKLYKNVSIYKYLDNDEYYSLISLCDYNFLPLTFSTANNVLLEAQSLGISSILPNISGISDYAAPVPNNIIYNNNDDLQDKLKKLEKKGICEYLKIYAEKFSWTEIYKQLGKVYNSVYNN
jgi:glycosyltransferase involved in cell wall biosynthesis